MTEEELLNFIDELSEMPPDEAGRQSGILEEEILEDISVHVEKLKRNGLSPQECKKMITRKISTDFLEAIQFLKQHGFLDDQVQKDMEDLAKKAKKTIKEEIDFQYGLI